jgi:uncharacterized protein YcaQ
MTDSISQQTARRLLLHAQLLDGRTKIANGKAGIEQVIGHLGYVQIDTIAVIERAHHHTLWTRVPGYRSEHLQQAQAGKRSVFEYWGHAASFLPIDDYRFYLPMMKSIYDPKNSWFRGWGDKYGAHIAPVHPPRRSQGGAGLREPGGTQRAMVGLEAG